MISRLSFGLGAGLAFLFCTDGFGLMQGDAASSVGAGGSARPQVNGAPSSPGINMVPGTLDMRNFQAPSTTQPAASSGGPVRTVSPVKSLGSLQAAVAAANRIKQSLSQPSLAKLASAKPLGEIVDYYLANVENCDTARNNTIGACDEKESTILQSIKESADRYGSSVVQVLAASTSCTKTNKFLSGVNSSLLLFKGECTANSMKCMKTCGTLKQKITIGAKQANTLAAEASTDPQAAAPAQGIIGDYNILQQEVEGGTPQSVASKSVECKSVAETNLKAAQQQANDATRGVVMAMGCQKETDGSGFNAMNMACDLQPDRPDCSCDLSQNAKSLRCICQKDPRNAGCNTGLAKAGTSAGSQVKIGTGANSGIGPLGKANPNATDNSGEAEESIFGDKKEKPGADAGGGFATGSGAGLGGSGGSGNSMDPSATPGGGGSQGKASSSWGGWSNASGGGMRFGSGRDSMDPDKKAQAEKIRKEALNHIRMVSSTAEGAAMNAEITGGGGRSNWEKVKSRYIDNFSNLLTQPGHVGGI